MNLELEILNPLTIPDWDERLLRQSEYSFFHSSNWARVLVESYHYTPLYFSLIVQERILVLVPVMEAKSMFTGVKGISLPFTDNSNPIIDGVVPWEDVYAKIIDFGKRAKWKYLEIRGDTHYTGETPSTSFYGHILPLSSDEKALLANCKNGTKGNIKKAVKEGVQVTIDQSPQSLDQFYKLNCITRQRHGLPSQPFSFFQAIGQYVLNANKGFVVLAFLEGKPIAGAMFFHFGSKVLYKYAASDFRFQHVRANNLVMWEAIRWYGKNGFTSLDMGRTEPYNEGLRQYKLGWGAREELIKYYKYDYERNGFIQEKNPAPGFYTVFLKKMPIPVLNVMGSLAYKHMA